MKVTLNEILDCMEVSFDIKKVGIVFLSLITITLVGMVIQYFKSIFGYNLITYLLLLSFVILLLTLVSLVSITICKLLYQELTIGERISLKSALIFAKDKLIRALSGLILFLIVGAIIYFIHKVIFLFGSILPLQLVLSLFTAPLILIDSVLLIFALVILAQFFPAISIDEMNIVTTFLRLFKIAKKLAVRMLASLSISVILGVMMIAPVFLAVVVSNLFILVLFIEGGSIFEALSATELPTLAIPTYYALKIFVVSSALVFIGFLSILMVFLKAICVNFYIKIKSSI